MGARWVVIPIVGAGALRQTGCMPASDVVLLPLCIGLALIGVIVAGVAWRRGSRGRVVQGVALALAPVALYFAGLLPLLWNAVVAVVGWASSIIFTPAIWFGLSLLALCVVLWVVGGVLARRSAAKGGSASTAGTKQPAVGTGRGSATARPATRSSATASSAAPARKGSTKGQQAADEVDPELAEIEAILKNRGIN